MHTLNVFASISIRMIFVKNSDIQRVVEIAEGMERVREDDLAWQKQELQKKCFIVLKLDFHQNFIENINFVSKIIDFP
jgi:hypothetical protein